MTLRRNALYYFLRSRKINSAKIARENHVSRQSFQQQLSIDYWKLRLNVFVGVARVAKEDVPQVIDETIKIDNLEKKYKSLDETEFIENLRWGIYDQHLSHNRLLRDSGVSQH